MKEKLVAGMPRKVLVVVETTVFCGVLLELAHMVFVYVAYW